MREHTGQAVIGMRELETMHAEDLLAQACRRLAGLSKLTGEEMRLAGYPDSVSEIDVCEDVH